MSGLTRWLLALACFVATVACSRTAAAFCRATTCKSNCEIDANKCAKGTLVHWQTSCVGVSVDARGSTLLDRPEIDRALRDAMRAWNEVDCGGGRRPSIQLLQVADVECGRADYAKDGPNANVLHFRDERWDGPTSQDTIALTTSTYSKSGEIHDADIAVNTANKRISLGGNIEGAYDLRVVLTHELGHLLGIGHSQHRDATMFKGVETNDTSPRSLSSDDVAAICAAYPPDEARACVVEPARGLGGCADADAAASSSRCSAAAPVDVASRSGVEASAVVVAALAWGLRRRLRRLPLQLTTRPE